MLLLIVGYMVRDSESYSAVLAEIRKSEAVAAAVGEVEDVRLGKARAIGATSAMPAHAWYFVKIKGSRGRLEAM